MSQSENGAEDVEENAEIIHCSFQPMKETALQEIYPEMYRTKVEKFYRAFDDVPLDYVQTEHDFPMIMTRDDIEEFFDLEYVQDRGLHVTITGPPGAGKSTIAHRLANGLFDTKTDFMEQDYIVYALDMRRFKGNEVMSIPHFLFQQNSAKLSAELAECLWCSTITKPEATLFILHNLDTAPYNYEAECQAIDPFVQSAPVSMIVHNLLAGILFPKCKILSSCREHRLGKYPKKIRPNIIINIGEISEASQRALMKNFFGKGHAEPVQSYWFDEDPSLCLLNKTTQYLSYSIMSVGTGEFYKLAQTMPWALVNLFLSCIHQLHFPAKQNHIKDRILPILHKMKKVAYRGMKDQRYHFKLEEVTEEFGISLEDMATVSVCYPGRHENSSKLMVVRPDKLVVFVEDHVLEFLCALEVSELPIEEYGTFLDLCIHVPRFYNVRRMLCAIIFDSNIIHLVHKEGLRAVPTQDDLQQRQELLKISMSEEYHRVRRHDLLEFFHAVRDSGEGGAGIIPKKVDVVDLSHIQLHALDTQAIGAALSHGVKLDYLNLSNCIITPAGLRALADKIGFPSTKTEINRLNLDWNPGWQSFHTGKDGLCDIVKNCGVNDLSLNHCQLVEDTLHTLHTQLRETKLKVFRVQHNSSLDTWSYAILGDFIAKHDVEHLYVSAKDLDGGRTSNLHFGRTAYILETTYGGGSRPTLVATRLELD